MGKTTAQRGAHVVKDGIRHKDVYATAVGDTTKAYFSLLEKTCDLYFILFRGLVYDYDVNINFLFKFL